MSGILFSHQYKRPLTQGEANALGLPLEMPWDVECKPEQLKALEQHNLNYQFQANSPIFPSNENTLDALDKMNARNAARTWGESGRFNPRTGKEY